MSMDGYKRSVSEVSGSASPGQQQLEQWFEIASIGRPKSSDVGAAHLARRSKPVVLPVDQGAAALPHE